jgi:hypothetical protein
MEQHFHRTHIGTESSPDGRALAIAFWLAAGEKE